MENLKQTFIKKQSLLASVGLLVLGLILGAGIGATAVAKLGHRFDNDYKAESRMGGAWGRGGRGQVGNGRDMMNMGGMDHGMMGDANGNSVPQVSGMQSMMGSMMNGLNGKTGDDFDKAFLSEMVMHHEGAVAMAQQVLATSKRPELIKLANDIISAQTTEINQMKSWASEWFK